MFFPSFTSKLTDPNRYQTPDNKQDQNSGQHSLNLTDPIYQISDHAYSGINDNTKSLNPFGLNT